MSKENWFAPSLLVPDRARIELSDWARYVKWPEGTKLKPPSKYHMTLVYCAEGRAHPRHEAFLASIQPPASFRVWTARLEQLSPGNDLHTRPIGVVLSNPLLCEWVEKRILLQAGWLGLGPSTYGSFLPHVTVAEIPPGPFALSDIDLPNVTWDTPWEVVDLHAHYDAMEETNV